MPTTRSWRRDDLDTRAIGERGGEQRMLAAYSLRARRRDLTREPGKRAFVELGRIATFDAAGDGFGPDLASAVDPDVCDVSARQIGG